MANLFENKIDPPPPVTDKWKPGDGLGTKIEIVFLRFVQRYFTWGYKYFAEFVVNIIDAGFKILKPGMMRMFTPILDEAEKVPGMPPYIKNMIAKAKAETGEAGAFGVGIIAMAALYQLLGAALQPVGNVVTQGVNTVLDNYNPSPNEAAFWYRQRLIEKPLYDQLTNKAGVSEQLRTAIYENTRTLPTVGEMIQAYWRGIKGEANLDEYFLRTGYREEDAKIFKELAKQIPPLTDLIHFMVREAFDDGTASRFGYDEAYPAKINEYLPKIGFDADWGKRYWRAHWNLPSPTQAYEMLHRGQITTADLDALLKTADYPKFWRDKLAAISYSTYTRVDIRRMFQAGVLSEAEVFAAHKELGYDDSKARKLTDWVSTMFSQEEKDLTKSEILNMYEVGLTDRGATAQALMKMGYDNLEAEDLLKLADYQIAKAARTETINYIKEQFKAGVISDATARNELAKAGLKEQSVERYVLSWTKQTTTEVKYASVADTKRWFLADYIDENKARQFIRFNKYTKEVEDLFIREWTDLKNGGGTNEQPI